MSDAKTLWELKEKAKWSHDTEECKMAVQELSRYGEMALPSLEEVLTVAAYDVVKAACIEAIKAVKEKKQDTVDIKKNEQAVEEKQEKAPELSLADLPP